MNTRVRDMKADGIYSQLCQGQRQIRVLHLKPSEGFEAELQASLKTVSLQDHPQYQALSYCWGKTVSSRSISIDGVEMSITENLEAALRQLRSSSRTLTLWNDALCINQTDDGERSAQVAMMDEVYKSASTVLVWLGPEADDSSLALETIQTWTTELLTKKNKNYLFDQSRAEGLDIRSWTAIRNLLDRRYWSRTWIFQEIMLGQKVTVHCGNQMLDWESFRALDEAHR